MRVFAKKLGYNAGNYFFQYNENNSMGFRKMVIFYDPKTIVGVCYKDFYDIGPALMLHIAYIVNSFIFDWL